MTGHWSYFLPSSCPTSTPNANIGPAREKNVYNNIKEKERERMCVRHHRSRRDIAPDDCDCSRNTIFSSRISAVKLSIEPAAACVVKSTYSAGEEDRVG